MSLTLLEINYLNGGSVQPAEMSIQTLLTLQLRRQALWFRENLKEIEDNPLAQNYKTKTLQGVNRVLRDGQENQMAKTMFPIFTTIIGNIADNLQTVKEWTFEQWATQAENNIVELFQYVVGITKEEETAYNEY